MPHQSPEETIYNARIVVVHQKLKTTLDIPPYLHTQIKIGLRSELRRFARPHNINLLITTDR